MPALPRRRALLAAASGIAALAGCAGSETASNSYPTRDERRIDDYELERVRDETGRALFARSDAFEPSSDERSGSSTDEGSEPRRRGRIVVTESEDRSPVEFDETAAAERLRSFVSGTDFDAASVYLLSMPVDACHEVRLRSVSVEPDELANDDLHPHADFCRAFRPADVDCDPDETHTVGFAIRIPVAAERSTGSGSGMGSSCRRGDPPAVFNASASGTGGDDA